MGCEIVNFCVSHIFVFLLQRIVRDDIMTSVSKVSDTLFSPKYTISPFTLSLLDDSSWYKSEFRNVDSTVFGYGAGCDFLTEPCIADGSVPSHSQGVFCNERIPFLAPNFPHPMLTKNACDVDYNNKAVCDLLDYDDELSFAFGSGLDPPPANFQYFTSPTLGVFYNRNADFCPMREMLLQVDCTDELREADFAYDTYSIDSRCFNTDQTKAVCLRSKCNADTGKIEGLLRDVNQEFICDFDGQVKFFAVDPPEASFTFVCPPVRHFCPQ